MADDATTPATPPSPEPGGWHAPPASPAPPPPPDPTGAVPAARPAGPGFTLDSPLGLALGLVAVAGVVLGLVLRSTQGNLTGKLWNTMGWAWAVLAIAAAATALLPALRGLVNLSAAAAGEIAAVGAGVLTLWWVLFVLPYIQLNTAFLATAGLLAAVGAAWVARPPARSLRSGDDSTPS